MAVLFVGRAIGGHMILMVNDVTVVLFGVLGIIVVVVVVVTRRIWNRAQVFRSARSYFLFDNRLCVVVVVVSAVVFKNVSF